MIEDIKAKLNDATRLMNAGDEDKAFEIAREIAMSLEVNFRMSEHEKQRVAQAKRSAIHTCLITLNAVVYGIDQRTIAEDGWPKGSN